MKLHYLNWLANIAVLLALGATINLAVAAPDSKIQKFWMTHDETSTTEVSHQAWQEILDKYLDAEHASGVNRFDYAAVKKSDRRLLNDYLDALQAIDPHLLSRAEQLAYWINFYNALTVRVVLEEYPIESIRSIRFLTSPFGPWDKNLVKVKNQDLSLNDIEHEILRPIWQDPRIHFAVNCASIGCPNLIDKAFSAANSDELMEAASLDFINHSRGVEIRGGKVTLSSIFDWYGDDFGVNESEIMAYIRRYRHVSGETHNITSVEYQYDWKLNRP
ncbi:MAG: DUF547 domain-containing protein [Arenicella sp.]|nr:DUF547 domain-containing protein [Arenicella sp.]